MNAVTQRGDGVVEPWMASASSESFSQATPRQQASVTTKTPMNGYYSSIERRSFGLRMRLWRYGSADYLNIPPHKRHPVDWTEPV